MLMYKAEKPLARCRHTACVGGLVSLLEASSCESAFDVANGVKKREVGRLYELCNRLEACLCWKDLWCLELIRWMVVWCSGGASELN